VSSNIGAIRIRTQPDNDYQELRRAKAKFRSEGINFIDLSEGLPDLEPDPRLVEKLNFYCQQPKISSYPNRQGVVILQKAIIEYMNAINGYVEGMQVLPSAGSKELIAHASMALLNPGDIVLLPELHYPFYRLSASYAGAIIRTYPLTKDGRYQPDFETLDTELLKAAKLLWVNYPHSPTGAILEPESAKRLVFECRKADTIVIADAAYSLITRKNDVVRSIFTGLQAKEGILELHTLSKSLSIPGWRFGFVAGDPRLITLLESSKAIFDSGIFTAIQKACAYGLRHIFELSSAAVAEYSMRVEQVSSIFLRNNISFGPAEGTFYLWIALPSGSDSREFVAKLLEEEKILLLPGTFFGEKGKEYIRMSLTQPLDVLEEAAKRIIHRIQLLTDSGIKE